MLTNGMFGTLLTPESIVTPTALDATTCSEGDVLVSVGPADALALDDPLEPFDPPPPPPHALTSNASSVAKTGVMSEDLQFMIRSVIE
jgi:hypothetical protein